MSFGGDAPNYAISEGGCAGQNLQAARRKREKSDAQRTLLGYFGIFDHMHQKALETSKYPTPSLFGLFRRGTGVARRLSF